MIYSKWNEFVEVWLTLYSANDECVH